MKDKYFTSTLRNKITDENWIVKDIKVNIDSQLCI